MSKSLGNSFLPRELFTGDHEILDEPYTPMTVKFFMLQSHYSSTLDFSNDALKAARKGYKRLINGLRLIKDMEYIADDGQLNEKAAAQVEKQIELCHFAMNDDFNTALAIGQLMNLLKKINSLNTGVMKYAEIGEDLFARMKKTYIDFVEDVLGLQEEDPAELKSMVESMLEIYRQAKHRKDFDKVDEIRASLKENGIIVKDMKSKIDWAYEE